ncbi:hypothetical protein Hanom_Chr07g00630071 [Helianthus anomalus]
MGSIKIQSKTELYRLVLGLRRIKNRVKPFSLDETAWKSFNFSDA